MNVKTVKGKILILVLPIVFFGLLILSAIIFNRMNDAFETQILESSLTTTKEIGEGVSEWLDKRMMETQETASIPSTRNLNAEEMNRNNVYRLKLMQQRYPGVYDSVSWGPFDGSGTLYGETSSGFKEMHNQDKAWYKETMTAKNDSFMSSPVVSQATGKIIVNSIAISRNDAGNPVAMVLAAIYVQAVMDKVGAFKLGEEGYSLLVSKEGVYIVNPDEDAIMKSNILEESDATVAELGKRMLSGESGVYQFTSGGKDLIAFYTPINATGTFRVCSMYFT